MRAEQKAVQKLELGQQIAARVRLAAIEQQHSLAEKEALLLDRCSTCENGWVGKEYMAVLGGELESPDGQDVEMWDAHGRFWQCGNRLCPGCSERIRRRARRMVKKAIAEHRQRVGYAWRFVTLTQPTLAVSLLESIKILRRAWQLLYKREFWKQHVQGGALGMEFEVNQIGYHTHLHILVSSRFIPVELLIEEWELCVTKAHAETDAAAVDHCKKCGLTRAQHAGPSTQHCTPHPFRLNASVSVRLVRPKPGTTNAVTMRDAINEVIKYVTKPKTWLELPEPSLVELATVKRWPRMFELFGSMKAAARAAANPILDTEAITHGSLMREPGEDEPDPSEKHSPSLRSLLEKLTLAEIAAIVTKRIKDAAWFRLKQMAELYPGVLFYRLRDYISRKGITEALLLRVG